MAHLHSTRRSHRPFYILTLLIYLFRLYRIQYSQIRLFVFVVCSFDKLYLAIQIFSNMENNASLNTQRKAVIPVKRRLRFREEDDLNLLREVSGQNPFENPSVWENIKENMYSLSQKDFTIKTLKDHLYLLIKIWLEKIKTLKDRSGIEEAYTEKDQLCQNIYDYMMQFSQKSEKKKSCLSQDKLRGKSARDECATKLAIDQMGSSSTATLNMEGDKENVSLQDHTYYEFDEMEHNTIEIESFSTADYTDNAKCNVSNFSQSVSDQEVHEHTPSKSTVTSRPSKVLRPVKSRKRKINAQRQGIAYLEKYDENQRHLKETEYALEERRIALEERKCALEEARLALEERKHLAYEKKIEHEIEKEKNRVLLEKERHLSQIEENKSLIDTIQKQNQLLATLVNKLVD